jgi:MoaA/NifB/PqqE/SkfB family radical SAM enzyme
MSDAPGTLAPPLPRSLQVEVTAACNLRCRMCLVRYRPPVDRVTGSMSLELFRRLVDDLPGLERVTLQGLGEPLLVPHLDDMVAYAAARGIDAGFNTNGTLLSPARAERLVRAGLAWLHVSVDGATPETYEGIRDGSRFERVRRGVRAIVGAKRRLGAERPDVRIVSVAMRRNHHELPDLVRLAAEWGVDKIWVQNLSHSFSDTELDADYAAMREWVATEALWSGDDRRQVEASFAAAREVAGALGVELRLPRLVEPPAELRPAGVPGCGWPFEEAYVTHDGRAQPCCMVMGADRAVLGRVGNGTSFADVWHGDDYRSFRQGLLGDEPPEVCRGCSLYRRVF